MSLIPNTINSLNYLDVQVLNSIIKKLIMSNWYLILIKKLQI